MKHLLDAFLDLPSWQGACIITAAVVLLALAYFVGVHVGFRLGSNWSIDRHHHFATKRRELASIRL